MLDAEIVALEKERDQLREQLMTPAERLENVVSKLRVLKSMRFVEVNKISRSQVLRSSRMSKIPRAASQIPENLSTHELRKYTYVEWQGRLYHIHDLRNSRFLPTPAMAEHVPWLIVTNNDQAKPDDKSEEKNDPQPA